MENKKTIDITSIAYTEEELKEFESYGIKGLGMFIEPVSSEHYIKENGVKIKNGLIVQN